MAKRYGVPYQGSKNAIAAAVVNFLPAAETLVDICAGGCAVTHAALESGKWARVIANDVNPMPVQLFWDAVHGKYRNETRWITREEFHALKATDPYVRYCWSFGNIGENYLYGVEIEPWKKALHWARVYGDTSLLREMGIESDGSRVDVQRNRDEYREKYIRWWLSQQEYTTAELDELIAQTKDQVEVEAEELRQYLLDGLKKSGLTQAEVQRRLGTQMAGHYFGRSQWEFPTEEMYRKMQEFMPYDQDYNEIVGLYRLRQSLQSLQSLEISSMDYAAVPVPENSVIYADIPYEGTDCKGYQGFDHARFYDWAAEQATPVFVSSYDIGDGRFTEVWAREKTCLLQGGGASKKIEKIYANKPALEVIRHEYIYSP